MGVAVLLVMILYVLLAVGLVFLVRWITPKKLYRWLAVAFVILLPTWDAVLGYMIYYPACLFVPKVAIYETAETDGIYYEGLREHVYKMDRRSAIETEEELTAVGAITSFGTFARGYSFAESKVTEEYVKKFSEKKPITPVIYRCTSLPEDPSKPDRKKRKCYVVKDIQSKYAVKVSTITVGPAQLNFKKIFEISSGKLMAEYNRVVLRGLMGIIVPFFSWLDWADGVGINQQCPGTEREYEDFEFRVLKPKH